MFTKLFSVVKKWGAVVGAFGLLAVSSLPAFAGAQSDPEVLDVDTGVEIVTDAVTSVSSMLVQTLPIIFGLLALLIGVFFIWRQISKRIGRAK